jgi:hypothetical protein
VRQNAGAMIVLIPILSRPTEHPASPGFRRSPIAAGLRPASRKLGDSVHRIATAGRSAGVA